MTETAALPAERSLLGSLLIDGSLLARVRDVRPDDFALAAHGWIYSAIVAVDGRKMRPDLVLVQSELELTGRLGAVGGTTYVSSLVDGLPDVENVESYANIVREDAVRRSGLVLVDRMRGAFGNGRRPGDVLADFAANAHELAARVGGAATQAGEPTVATLAAVLAEEKGEPVWIVKNLLAVGAVGVLSADYYVGKSTLLALLCAHVAVGRSFLGFDVPRPLPVLYCQAEGNRRMFAERVACACYHAGIDVTTLGFSFPPSGFAAPFDSEEFRGLVIASGAKLVVCDSVGYFLNEKAEENSSSDWKRFVMKPLRSVAAVTGASFILAHHYGKPAENRTGRHRPRGASAIGADGDTVLRLEAPNGEKAAQRTLFFDKVRDEAAPDTMALRFVREQALFVRDETAEVVQGAAPREARAKERLAAKAEADRKAKEDAALLFRRTPRGLTAEDLRIAFGREKKWAADTVGEFHAQGLVERGVDLRENGRHQTRRVPVWKWTAPEPTPEPNGGDAEAAGDLFDRQSTSLSRGREF